MDAADRMGEHMNRTEVLQVCNTRAKESFQY